MKEITKVMIEATGEMNEGNMKEMIDEAMDGMIDVVTREIDVAMIEMINEGTIEEVQIVTVLGIVGRESEVLIVAEALKETIELGEAVVGVLTEAVTRGRTEVQTEAKKE